MLSYIFLLLLIDPITSARLKRRVKGVLGDTIRSRNFAWNYTTSVTNATDIDATPWKDLMKFEKKLGEGTFGIASLFSMKSPCQGIAVMKKIKEGGIASEMDEADALKELKHPNIIRMFDYYPDGAPDDEIQGYILFEPAFGGEITESLLKHRGGIMERMFTFSKKARAERRELKIKLVSMMMVDILRGLVYMHQKGFIHRDIKPENVWEITVDDNCMLDLTCHFVIGDLGLATTNKYSKTADWGTELYTPDDFYWSKRGDIFSLGLSLQLMLLGKDTDYAFGKAKDGASSMRYQIWKEVAAKDYIPSKLEVIVQHMAKVNIQDRPTAREALEAAEEYFEEQYGHKKALRETPENQCLEDCKNCRESSHGTAHHCSASSARQISCSP